MTRWAYGVTTVPARLDNLLPRTLTSLRLAGFDKPRLFVDGLANAETMAWERQFGLPVTARDEPVSVAGNWVLTAYELYIRDPNAERYALFQDDLITLPGLRTYLESCAFPANVYWNLYQSPSNLKIVPKDPATGEAVKGWYPSNQFGRGALALVFNRNGLIRLLSSDHLINRFWDNPLRGWRAVDGGIVDSMRKAGYQELVHHPSLVKHTGKISAMNKLKTATRDDPPPDRPFEWPSLYDRSSFPGETFDALQLLLQVPSNQLTEPISESQSCQQSPTVQPGAIGAEAYSIYPEKQRLYLVAEWQAEIRRLLEAARADDARAAASTDRMRIRRFSRSAENYRQRLAELERNETPYYPGGKAPPLDSAPAT